MNQPSRRPPEGGQDESLFDFKIVRGYVALALGAPRRHKILAVCSFVIVFTLAVLAAWAIPQRYQVSATLLAQRSTLMTTLATGSGMDRQWDSPARAAREVLIRRETLERLAERTRLPERYIATASPASRFRLWLREKLSGRPIQAPDLLGGIVDGLEKKLWVVTGQDGNVTINFVWTDPEITFDVVNAAIQAFLEQRHKTDVEMVGDTIAILEGHEQRIQGDIAKTLARLEEKERALQIRPRRLPVRRAAPAQDPEVVRLEVRLADRRRALNELEDVRARRVQELQLQLQQQLGVYAPGHPAIRSTETALEAAQGASPQVDSLRAEIAEAERELTRRGGSTATPAVDLQAELAGAYLREPVDPRLEYERRQLDQLVRQHETLLGRIAAARVELDTAEAAFKYRYSVITPPQMPRGPLKPYGALLVLGGLLGGLAMAIFVAAAADLRSGKVVERCQVEQLELPILAELRK